MSEDTWWKEHCDLLDRNWERHHDACMNRLRDALGMPHATVPEMEQAIELMMIEKQAWDYWKLAADVKAIERALGMANATVPEMVGRIEELVALRGVTSGP